MTLLYCIFSLAPPGGMQRVLTVKANYLADIEGYTVHIVTRQLETGKPHFALSPAIKLHHTGKDYKKDLTDILYAIRPDIVISLYGEESRFLHRIADGSKKILEFHFTRNHLVHLVKGIPRLRFRRLRIQYVRLLQYLDARCAPHYDRLVLLTEADRHLWGHPVNAVVIPNPLSFTSPVKSSLSDKRVIAAGRLIATKGFDLLIDAWRHVAARHPDWTLTIFGEGQDHRYLLDKIHTYGLSQQIEILPPISDIAAEMRRSTIYAAPSRYEGFGLVIIEAMECGIPTVAFDCECGPGEIITDGVDGILVETFDTHQFADALLQLIENPDLRQSLGANALQSAQRYAPDRIMQHWKTLFHTLIHHNTTVNAR